MQRTLFSLILCSLVGASVFEMLSTSPEASAQPQRRGQGGGLWESPSTGGLPDVEVWGRGMPALRPTSANAVFATGDGCAMCHSASENAAALWSETGEDVSPHGLWEGTLMANSARDPYWRAQLAAESAADPARAEEFEQLCMRCHTPMAHHTHKLAQLAPLRAAEAAGHPLFGDGVSCTVCHQIRPDNLGTEASFNGNPVIETGRVIFGPYADPAGGPMLMHTNFTPTLGAHIRSSALCGACHTLETAHTGGSTLFPEQSPYLEWRNSSFNTEVENPAEFAADCIDCHMPGVGSMRIARNPRGLDFNIETRDGVKGHSFVGANAFMLDMLRENAEELGVTAPAAALERNARATRALLSHRTAKVEVSEPIRESTVGGETLVFDVTVTNLAGHKLPSAYPSRRVWVETLVRDGGTAIFDSGDFDERGRLIGVNDELAIPHYDVITSPDQVQVYEMVATDTSGAPTTILTRMATRQKDNRLLPVGWSEDGPHTDKTHPVGIGGDDNFAGGTDTVTYRVPLPEGTGDSCTIIVWLWMQTIPPAWADGLRGVGAEETERFLRMYDNASPAPERLALTVRIEGQ